MASSPVDGANLVQPRRVEMIPCLGRSACRAEPTHPCLSNQRSTSDNLHSTLRYGRFIRGGSLSGSCDPMPRTVPNDRFNNIASSSHPTSLTVFSETSAAKRRPVPRASVVVWADANCRMRSTRWWTGRGGASGQVQSSKDLMHAVNRVHRERATVSRRRH